MKILFLAVVISSQVFAWGPTGHRAIGEIAERQLSPEVLAKVKAILEGQTLAQVSTWGDEIKSDPKTYGHTFNWHYMEWPEGKKYDEKTSNGSLLRSLSEQVMVLKDKVSSQEKKNFALKMLVHLVGDMHMPLHVGTGLDTGATKCEVLYHGERTTLHRVWDEDMIDRSRLSFTELANFASNRFSESDKKSWSGGTPLEWAEESKALRGLIYPPHPKTYCRDDGQVPESKKPSLGYDYSDKTFVVLQRRIFQGGLRLGQLVNEALR